MITLNKTLRLFLDSIGRRDEYEFYLDKFQATHSSCFALLCPDLNSVESAAEVLAFDLQFLMRLELVPAILLSGKEANAMQAVLKKEAIFLFKRLKKCSRSDETLHFIQEARKKEKVPVFVSHSTLEELLLTFVPNVVSRVHFIRAEGGLRNTSGKLLDYLYTHKESNQALESSGKVYLERGRTLLKERPSVHISITSPINLLQEIFTVRGAGTVFRKGSIIHHYHALEDVSVDRLTNLLEESFGKKIKNKSFFDAICDSYIEEHYRGAVLLEQHTAGLYLSKYAVGKEARGEGIAVELWRKVCRNHKAFFWRSNRKNPFNAWYAKQADGYHTEGKWQVFWRGVSVEAISDMVRYCMERNEDFDPDKIDE